MLVPGPTVFVASDAVMVARESAAQHLGDLAGRGICFMIASTAEQGLEAWFDDAGKPWFRHPYSETGEMEDAYAVQRCEGIAAETTELARIRLHHGPAGLQGRILPEPLGVFPLIAATGTDDGRWSAIVAWTVHTLIDAGRPQTQWFAGGADAMPVVAPELGLGTGWQARVIQATGPFSALFERNLGAGSPYRLAPGPDALQGQGGLLLSPFVE